TDQQRVTLGIDRFEIGSGRTQRSQGLCARLEAILEAAPDHRKMARGQIREVAEVGPAIEQRAQQLGIIVLEHGLEPGLPQLAERVAIRSRDADLEQVLASLVAVDMRQRVVLATINRVDVGSALAQQL